MQNGQHKQSNGQHTLAAKKIYKKDTNQFKARFKNEDDFKVLLKETRKDGLYRNLTVNKTKFLKLYWLL